MVRKYFVQQLGLLLMVSVIIILTNIIGYKMPVKDSIIGVLLLSAISLIGLTICIMMIYPEAITPFTSATPKTGWTATPFLLTGLLIFLLNTGSNAESPETFCFPVR